MMNPKQMKIMSEQQNDKVKMTGLWRNTTAKGDMYLSGNVGLAKMLIFPNGYKEEGSNDPDYYMFLAPKKQREEGEEYHASNPQPEVKDDVPF